ncbi:MAG: hypothetical protein M1829_001956 [Trizodia sp. TS-e1964]|nr:MAG: hypothetical protein M1829_001956 [Trizodia sp. TS-e1964]
MPALSSATIQMPPSATIRTWLNYPLFIEQGFLVVPVCAVTGRSKVDIFDALENDLPQANASTLRLPSVRQKVERKGNICFIEHSPTETEVSYSSLKKKMEASPELSKSTFPEGPIGPFNYLPDLSSTKKLARVLRMPWPSLLSNLGDNLLRRHELLDGITKPYIYISPSSKGSLFGLHVEDFNLFSLNLMHFGNPKHWIMIPPSQQPALFRLLQPLCSSLFGPSSEMQYVTNGSVT